MDSGVDIRLVLLGMAVQGFTEEQMVRICTTSATHITRMYDAPFTFFNFGISEIQIIYTAEINNVYVN